MSVNLEKRLPPKGEFLVDSDVSKRWWRELWRPLTRADKALIITSLVACAVAYDSPWRGEGGEFHVRVVRTIHGPYSLAMDREYEFEGPLGITRISVERGSVAVTSSPCPNGICIRSGSIRRVGQALACVPNRVVLEVEGQSFSARFDAVAR